MNEQAAMSETPRQVLVVDQERLANLISRMLTEEKIEVLREAAEVELENSNSFLSALGN